MLDTILSKRFHRKRSGVRKIGGIPDLAPPAPFPSAHQNRSAVGVKVALGQRQRLADPQPGAPQHHDQAAEPDPVAILAGGAHDRDDLLHRRRVWRVPQATIAGRAAVMVAGQGRRRAGSARAVQQRHVAPLRRWAKQHPRRQTLGDRDRQPRRRSRRPGRAPGSARHRQPHRGAGDRLHMGKRSCRRATAPRRERSRRPAEPDDRSCGKRSRGIGGASPDQRHRDVANPIAHPEDGYWTKALVGDRGPDHGSRRRAGDRAVSSCGVSRAVRRDLRPPSL